MSRHSHERRRQLVVNKPMQSRLILSMALMPAIALAAIAVLTAVWCSRTMEEAYANDTELPNLSPLFYLVVAFELIAALYLMVNSLKVSHRVAGPAYRICKSLERIRNGDLAFTVGLRKGDHLTEIRDEMNLLLDWLNANPPKGCITRAMAQQQKDATAQPSVDSAPSLLDAQQVREVAATALAATAAANAEIEVVPSTPRDDDGA
jgi:hypothetical protein